jgi:hypothetical protein
MKAWETSLHAITYRNPCGERYILYKYSSKDSQLSITIILMNSEIGNKYAQKIKTNPISGSSVHVASRVLSFDTTKHDKNNRAD